MKRKSLSLALLLNRAACGTSLLLLIALLFSSCREPEDIDPSIDTPTGDADANAGYSGFYLLCEGSYGGNDSSLDYYDYRSGVFSRNIYAERNPSQVMGLGDVGNDIAVYGGKLYAVIGGSHRVEVMNVSDASHIAGIDVVNCRYLAFHDGFAYVTSYGTNTPAVEGWGSEATGYVAKVDTATLAIVDTCHVGYQPEELAVMDGRLYVANSGGYRYPDYDHTVSVIDLASFRVISTIDVGINLHRIEAIPSLGLLAVTSRGDYYTVPGALYLIDGHSGTVIGSTPLGSTADIASCADTLYVYSMDWGSAPDYRRIVLAKDAAEPSLQGTPLFAAAPADIVVPYSLAVNGSTGDVLICDARDYVTPGRLHCFSSDGTQRWTVVTGVMPSRIAFVPKPSASH